MTQAAAVVCATMTQISQDHQQAHHGYLLFDAIEKKPGLCWHFKRKGFCNLGNTCKFFHPESLQKQQTSEVATCSKRLAYWVCRAKEENSATSVLRRTFEENGFAMIVLKTEDVEKRYYTAVYWGNAFPYNNLKHIPSYTYINHFSNSHQLTNKSLLTLNFQQVNQGTIQFKSQFIPPSFSLPMQMDLFMNHVNKQGDCIWIVKPAGSGEGRGINLYSCMRDAIIGEYPEVSLDEINGLKIEDATMKKIKKRRLVICKYVQKPLLIDERKFDMRLYVLAVGDGRVYLYKDGIVRIASEKYSESNDTLSNFYIHITNNTVNNKKNHFVNEKTKRTFGFFNNMNLAELEEYLESKSLHFHVFWDRLRSLVSESIKLTLFNPDKADPKFEQYKNRCFEVLGYDVLVDADLNPYLLEVNSMPDLSGVSQSNHLVLEKDFDVKSKMLAGALNLVGVQLADPSVEAENLSSVFVEDLEYFERIL